MRLLLLFVVLNISLFAGNRTMFVVWGDSQFQNPEVFEEAVKQTAKLYPDFVLHVGDMIHGYTYDIKAAQKQWKRFKKQISPLKCDFLPTPGNHDLTTKEIHDAYREVWGANRFNYSYINGNAKIIVLNQFADASNFYKLSAVQKKWLVDELKNTSNNLNIFISMHSPEFLKENSGWDEIHKELTKYNVKAVFTGHYHMYLNKKIDGIEYFCLNTSGNIGANDHFLTGKGHQFMIVNCFGDDVKYTVFSDGEFYRYDIVEENAREKYGKYYNPEKTIHLSKTDITEKKKSGWLEVINNAPVQRTYTLKWMVDNSDWTFAEPVKVVNTKANDTVKVQYSLTIPDKLPKRDKMPYCNISSPLKLDNGYTIVTDYNYGLFVPPIGKVVKISGSITADGILDEDEWNKATVITNFEKDMSETPAEDQTYISILYDNTNLYVAAKMDEPNPAGMSLSAYGDLPLVFGDDDIELFFDPKNDQKTYYRIMINAKGTRLDSGPKGRYSFKYEAATKINDNNWVAEFIIPLKEIDTVMPEEGVAWAFNARRHRQQAEYVQSDWSKMRTHPPYQPEYFGKIIFTK